MTDFESLGLCAPLLAALDAEGYTTPTPIQAEAIPHLMDDRDVLGIAQTGTGKTAAFALPTLDYLAEDDVRARPGAPRVLVLAPTRELALQIADSFRTYGRRLEVSAAVVYGGVSIRGQVRDLARGVDVLVATPGRLLDLMNQGKVRLDAVDVYILDEADRMLDMGFAPDVKRITARVPTDRQTALFSATMPKAVAGLAGALLDDPVRVEVAPAATTIDRVDQRVLFVPKARKRELLTRLLDDDAMARVLIFTRTKHGANRLARQLAGDGIGADAIHGNKSQGARQRALGAFRDGRLRALVATDIAARGIDVDGVTHVVNFELPNVPESYVHRIGRTARAGAAGQAISLCDGSERSYLRDIERTIRQTVRVDADHPFHGAAEVPQPAADERPSNSRGGRNRRRSRPGGRPRRAA